ncbi:uncharacterized protein LOC129565645 [Sitodiplosis mosellana]|uniref:uncharacterized protein LOC129565645 n=1 Tax=Sitodiplosis mosellana TaxID=263140 RepID=UPI002444C659|nr:uncharacterized protein LOC129565645 [Sitodiplosis mosellana]
MVNVKSSGLTKSIGVAQIPSNGNCLFAAMAHQLFYSHSRDLAHQAARLREEVVRHIKANFDRYKHSIEGKIYEEQESVPGEKLTEEQVKTKAKSFLDESLSKSGYYGGYESLSAISEIYNVNILLFRENDDFRFVNEFNNAYEGIACVAYRSNADGRYNHYDSVVSIM